MVLYLCWQYLILGKLKFLFYNIFLYYNEEKCVKFMNDSAFFFRLIDLIVLSAFDLVTTALTP